MSDYRRPVRMGVVDEGQAVYVAHLPDGPITVLEGMAAEIWRLARDRSDVVADLAVQCGVPPEDIRTEVENFLDALVSRGLLERGSDSSGSRWDT